MTTLETERLWLRPLEMGDFDAFVTLMTHPDVFPFMGFMVEPDGTKRARTREEWRPRFEYRVAQYGWEGFGEWAVLLKDDAKDSAEGGAFVGITGLQFYLLEHGRTPGDLSTPEIELFYGLGRPYWGQGIITEAGRAAIHYAFEKLKLPRVTSVVYRENTRSLNVIQRLGMAVRDYPTDPRMVVGALENPATRGADPPLEAHAH